jgi:hypothetical protein
VTSNGQTWEIAELGGLTDLGSGLLGAKGFPVERPEIPAYVEWDGELIRWSLFSHPDFPDDPRWRPRIVDPKGMLDRFLRIESATDVLQFARTYGVLELCEHNLPSTHAPSPYPPSIGTPVIGCRPLGWSNGQAWEQVQSWFDYVSEANGIVRAASALQQGKNADAEDWAKAFGPMQPMVGAKGLTTMDEERQALAQRVQHWMRLGNVHPFMQWNPQEEPGFGLSGRTFGTLAIQIALAVNRAQDWAICSVCAALYSRQRAPQRGRRNYCSSKCARVGDSLRKRRQRTAKGTEEN